MIIIKYIVWAIFRKQIAILFILLSIFSCQELIKILEVATEGRIQIKFIPILLLLGLPEKSQLVIPLSLSLAIITTINALCEKNEIIAIYACGLSRSALLCAITFLIIPISLVATLNISLISPWTSSYQSVLKQKIEKDLSLIQPKPGQFQSANKGKTVIFVERTKGHRLSNVFLANFYSGKEKKKSILTANKGYLRRSKSGAQMVTLDRVLRVENTGIQQDFHITSLAHYSSCINPETAVPKTSKPEQKDIITLLKSDSLLSIAELNWRINIVLSVPLISLLAMSLSEAKSYYGRIISVAFSVILFLLFFLLHSLIRSRIEKGLLDSVVWFWRIDILYLFLPVSIYYLKKLLR